MKTYGLKRKDLMLLLFNQLHISYCNSVAVVFLQAKIFCELLEKPPTKAVAFFVVLAKYTRTQVTIQAIEFEVCSVLFGDCAGLAFT